MKQISLLLVIIFYGNILAFFTGCATTQPTLSRSATPVVNFIESSGFSWDEEEKIYKHTATKSTNLDHQGEWTNTFKQKYTLLFNEYCQKQGGQIDDVTTWQKRVYPVSQQSAKINTMIYSKLNANILGWSKISKICSVKETPIFGFSFKAKHKNYTGNGVNRDYYKGQDITTLSPMEKFAYNNVYQNSWWNVDIQAIVVDSKDFSEAKMFIQSMLNHIDSEKLEPKESSNYKNIESMNY